MTTREQGDLGEFSAIDWLRSVGAYVAVPLGHSPDWDLIAELDGRLLRVQVKTCGMERRRRWEVSVCTRGGNQSWSGLCKRLDPSRYDRLFVHVADGRRWFIPADEVGGGSHVSLGGPKYARFEVEPGRPFTPVRRASRPGLESVSRHRGDARAVKGSAL